MLLCQVSDGSRYTATNQTFRVHATAATCMASKVGVGPSRPETLTPTLLLPAGGSTIGLGVQLKFELPTTPLLNSVKLRMMRRLGKEDEGSPHEITLTVKTAGVHEMLLVHNGSAGWGPAEWVLISTSNNVRDTTTPPLVPGCRQSHLISSLRLQ